MPEPVTDLAYKPRDCAAGQKWNWCVKNCVPADSKMADCPPSPIPPIPPGTQPPPDKCIPGHPNCPPIGGHPGPGGPPPGHPPCRTFEVWNGHSCVPKGAPPPPRGGYPRPGGPGLPGPGGPHPGHGYFPPRTSTCFMRYGGNCNRECRNPFSPVCYDCLRTCGGGGFPLPRRGFGYRYRCPGPPYSFPCPYPPYYWPVNYFPTGYPILVSADLVPLTTVITMPGQDTSPPPVDTAPPADTTPPPVDTAPPADTGGGGLLSSLGGNSSIILIGLAVLVLIMVMKK